MHSHVLLYFLALLLGPATVTPAAPARTLTGIVRDPAGAGITGALVELRQQGRTLGRAETDRDGRFTLEVPAAAEGLAAVASASGFAPKFVPITGGAALEVTLDIAPYHQAIEVHAGTAGGEAVLDMAGVRESPARDVGEAITALDGVTKIRRGGIANDVVIRGFQQNNINVLVDGSRTYGACPNHMDPAAQHVDFAEVDRVEVTKGAFDVVNQGSLGATVNIVTRRPATGFSVRPSLSLGSFGFVNPAIGASWGNRAVRVLGGYSFRTSKPYRDGTGRLFTEYAGYGATAGTRSAFDIHSGWAETELSPADGHVLIAGYTRQQAGAILYPFLTMDNEYDNADRATLRYTGEMPGASLRTVRAEVYVTQVGHFMSDGLRRTALAQGQWRMAGDASTRTGGGRVEADIGKALTTGVEMYVRNWNMSGLMRSGTAVMRNATIPDVDTHSLGAYVTGRRSFPEGIRLTAGARYDRARMQATSPHLSAALFQVFHDTRKTSSTDTYASGNVRIAFDLPARSEAFAGAGTTARIPDAAERYINRAMAATPTVGNPLLPPTRNTEFSAGWGLNRDRIYIRPSAFYSVLDNFIVVNNQPRARPAEAGARFARSFTNVAARLYGGELGWGTVLTGSLSLNGGGSYVRGLARIRPEAGVHDRNLPEMPPLRAWATLRHTRAMFYAEAGTVAVNRQSRVSTDLRESPTPGYAVLNLRCGATRGRVSASVALDNLFDRFYYEHLSYFRDPFSSGVRVPEPGRNVFVQVRYAF